MGGVCRGVARGGAGGAGTGWGGGLVHGRGHAREDSSAEVAAREGVGIGKHAAFGRGRERALQQRLGGEAIGDEHRGQAFGNGDQVLDNAASVPGIDGGSSDPSVSTCEGMVPGAEIVPLLSRT